MILAGIDEAGLGPTIGPLATAAAALRVPDDWRPDTPWQRLAPAVTAQYRRDASGLGVADSKQIYHSGGLPAMEATLACFALAATGAVDVADAAVLPLAPPRYGAVILHACYSRRLDPFPAFCGADELRNRLAVLREALASARCAVAHLRAAWLFEPEFNRRCDEGLNKNQLLLLETGSHLAEIERLHPDESILIIVDKQGGRNSYLPFLSQLFPGLWIDTLAEGAEESAYRLRRAGPPLVVRFRAKADRDSFPTALASMAAKYVRERAMAELNAWFAARLPELPPTAGYPTDAKRWLDRVRGSGQAERLDLASLIRKR